MTDDRAEFERSRRENAAALADDEQTQRLARDLFAASDRHNYSYLWDWLGLPIIQTPADIVALQEIVWNTRPDVIVELGIARGGSLIFYSSILQLIGQGRVIGVDIDIRDHNRRAIEEHPLSGRVTMIEGSSVAPDVVRRVKAELAPDHKVMVVLDSNHTHAHVLQELRLYAPLVTPGQFLVVADTVVEYISEQAHRPREWGPGNNPQTALTEFLKGFDGFEVDPWINGKLLMTNSPGGYLLRVKPASSRRGSFSRRSSS